MPPPAIDVVFRPVGVNEVLSALKTIGQATLEAAKKRADSAAVAVAAEKMETEAIEKKTRAVKKAGDTASSEAARVVTMSVRARQLAEEAAKQVEKAAEERHKRTIRQLEEKRR